MWKTNTKAVRALIKEYLLNAARERCEDDWSHSYMDEPFIYDEASTMQYICEDIRATHWYKGNPNKPTYAAVREYLRGLPINLVYTYYDEWKLLNEWTGASESFGEAKPATIAKADDKYWHILTLEVLRWFDRE